VAIHIQKSRLYELTRLQRALRSFITVALFLCLVVFLGIPDRVMAYHFSPGDRIRIINVGSPSDPPPRGLLVLNSACGSSVGGVFDGYVGTIIANVVFCAGHYRYKIDWDGCRPSAIMGRFQTWN
jgi:hypothetical protein